MIVCKFGGSATTDIKCIKNIKKLNKNKNRKIFVFSAIGKYKTNDIKITDLLIEFCNNKNKNKQNELFIKILNKFNYLCTCTNVNINIKKELLAILKNYKINNNTEYIISRGEYLTTKIMSEYLSIKFIPAERIIYFKNNQLDYKKIKVKINYYLNKYKKIAVPGFYGIDENKNIKLFSRGGSDITGAVLCKITNSKIYENWTDISGVMQVNPLIIKSKQIKKLNYKELDLMTSYDAKVIHNDCVKILKDTNKKIYVKNIFQPNLCPTKISKNYKSKNMFIAYKIQNQKVNIIIQHKTGYKGSIDCELNNYQNIIQNLYKISC